VIETLVAARQSAGILFEADSIIRTSKSLKGRGILLKIFL
jgi:hypothetical protein